MINTEYRPCFMARGATCRSISFPLPATCGEAPRIYMYHQRSVNLSIKHCIYSNESKNFIVSLFCHFMLQWLYFYSRLTGVLQACHWLAMFPLWKILAAWPYMLSVSLIRCKNEALEKNYSSKVSLSASKKWKYRSDRIYHIPGGPQKNGTVDFS